MMPNVTLDAARAYVLDVAILPMDRAHAPMLLDIDASTAATTTTTTTTDPTFDASKNQAVVVGSGVVTFAQGVPPERRLAVTNSLLLAQLVARHNVPDASDLDSWYKQYTSVLANIGWLVETNSTTQTVDDSTDFDTHDAVLSIATALLGPGAVTALKLIGVTLDALANVDTTTPWMTIFNRETRTVNASNFQVALAQQTPDGHFVVSLMAFVLKGNTVSTQVLFFRAKTENVQFSHYASDADIDVTILDSLEPDLGNRVAAHSKAYISQLPDL
jgi:hypothetical protein